MIPTNVQRRINTKKNQNNNIKYLQNQQGRLSFFDKEENRNGPNWMSTKKQTDFTRDAKFIIKDLVRGNVDIEKHCHYFNEHIIINALKTEANTQAAKHHNIVTAMDYFIKNLRLQNIQPDYMLIATFQEEQNYLQLYTSLDVCFSNIMYSQEAYAQLNILMNNIRNNSVKNFVDEELIVVDNPQQ